jgi:FAD/FMN-containing dehydrogenase
VTGISDLRSVFAGKLLTDPADTAPFLTDWRGLWTGRARAVVQPDSTADVAAAVRWCAERRVPIVPQGGNTGMSGGATPDGSGDAIVLSLARLNRVRGIDTVNDSIIVEAGCILQAVQDAADRADRYFPLSLAAEGSCTIGGNLACNAGGTGVLRYGVARDLCLGLEIVTADGEIWDGLRGLRKDNSGYDLRNLFIGSEGTLGIITAAVLKLHPRPLARATAFVALQSPASALELLGLVRRRHQSALSAFELLSETCLSLVVEHQPGARRPLGSSAPWYVLIEFSGSSDEESLRADLEAVLMAGLDTGIVLDAAIAESLSQAAAFWTIREGISEAQGAIGKTIKHDIAVPISAIGRFLDQADAAVARRWPGARHVTFGHVGDGNLHYNFSPVPGQDGAAFMAMQDDLNALIHDIVVAHGGTISAEHGLGVLRRDEAARLKSPVELRLQHKIKHALDPLGILNPGKLIAVAQRSATEGAS